MSFDDYRPRVVDAQLASLLSGLPAVVIDGAKAVGKTSTACQIARTVHELDDPGVRALFAADPARLLSGDRPVLIDEWQRLPQSWDIVRRAVDRDATPGQFLLTGSATPDPTIPTHSGAGRIVHIRMRPMTLGERGFEQPTVSLAALLTGGRPPITGDTQRRLTDYVEEILASGLPGIRRVAASHRGTLLDGYLDRIVDHDFTEMGHAVRRPARLRRWLAAVAAASATVTSGATIRDAASGPDNPPPRSTTDPWADVLERLWMLDPLPAWQPSRNHLRELTLSSKHHVLDPALAARLIGVDAGALLDAQTGAPTIPRDGTLLGSLFEALVTLDVRVHAQAARARVAHLRTKAGLHEVDLIVERDDQRVVAIEVKLASTVTDHDCRHLHWLTDQLGDDLLDAAIITTGPVAYRRPDGIAVIPAALLGS